MTTTTKPQDLPTTQRFIHSGMNWHQFKLLQESFAEPNEKGGTRWQVFQK